MSSKYSIPMLLGALAGLGSTPATADHAWSSYHWARTANPANLAVIDSVTPYWQLELNTALGEWGASSKLELANVTGSDATKDRKTCKAVAGQLRVCNAAYGYNGWLGLATIGIKPDGHIDRGTAKMNDSYSFYWSDPNEKRHVMCQEIGHLFGLGHTSEDGSSQQTCMDYSSDPGSISPNAHDYEMLDQIYTHLDSYTTGSISSSGSLKNEGEIPPMGVRVHHNSRHEIWVAGRKDGGLWIHHVTLVPDENHEHLD